MCIHTAEILARVADFERLQLASAGAGEADTAAAGAAAGSTQPRLLQQRPRPASRSSSSQSRPFTLGVHLRTIVAYDSIRVDRSHERDVCAGPGSALSVPTLCSVCLGLCAAACVRGATAGQSLGRWSVLQAVAGGSRSSPGHAQLCTLRRTPSRPGSALRSDRLDAECALIVSDCLPRITGAAGRGADARTRGGDHGPRIGKLDRRRAHLDYASDACCVLCDVIGCSRSRRRRPRLWRCCCWPAPTLW